MTSDPVHYLSLSDVSERLRRGELKPTALTEMILARIFLRFIFGVLHPGVGLEKA